MTNPIVPLKSAIIGKAWVVPGNTAIIPASFVLPEEMTFSANESYLIGGLSFRTDRNMPQPVTVKAGEKLFFYSNPKRPGKQDPDYSVSVVLPVEQAEAVIAGSIAGAQAWRDAHPVVVAA